MAVLSLRMVVSHHIYMEFAAGILRGPGQADNPFRVPLGSRCEYLKQMPNLCLQFGRVGDGLRDFLAEQLAIAATEVVDGIFNGLLGHSQLSGDLGVAARAGFAR